MDSLEQAEECPRQYLRNKISLGEFTIINIIKKKTKNCLINKINIQNVIMMSKYFGKYYVKPILFPAI